jgi:hypothetical protein
MPGPICSANHPFLRIWLLRFPNLCRNHTLIAPPFNCRLDLAVDQLPTSQLIANRCDVMRSPTVFSKILLLVIGLSQE